jgi:hypothetical protein
LLRSGLDSCRIRRQKEYIHTNEEGSMKKKEALRNLEEALILLREVEGAVHGGDLETGLEFQNDFKEAVNEIERLQADLTEDDSND